ncbi:D-3-phosphoglycerate dehydrogenase [Saccharopolyspora antimicrobica]|uniref:D-3-phosphoglycerate dehydrogenase n=1 Tax=Saccharopolyspora antimicrobica TaxID=455193 RepID=A0A1I5LW14_9PSEU|nr:C-terminal binding protein [Saccharopolyspora antimicrobica]RKT89039.1 D-3-phosphoglycerate dehydrogenase [Saccharopolyspora antimicrobica]SFP01564.1 D-3-phosphoglycerate dehydrogenase [Saccharopolyspora antimicrobica]
MTRVVVTDHAFGDVVEEASVARRFDAEFAELQCETEAETAAAVTGADVAFVNFAPITARVLRAMAPGATVIRYGIGYDNVDLVAARQLGIAVANVPDYGSDTVADHSVASLLALLRKLTAYDRRVRESGWCAPRDLGSLPGFASTTVGLIGLGRIGIAVRERLRAFGFRVIACDPHAAPGLASEHDVELVGLAELLAESHAVSLHAPLTPGTKHLLDGDAFARIRRGAVVVNTSRGGLVDHDALADAVESGQVSAAALDVFDSEPLAADSRLRLLPQVLLTPHTAFFSDSSLAALQRLAAEEAVRALSKEPLRCPIK